LTRQFSVIRDIAVLHLIISPHFICDVVKVYSCDSCEITRVVAYIEILHLACRSHASFTCMPLLREKDRYREASFSSGCYYWTLLFTDGFNLRLSFPIYIYIVGIAYAD